MVDRNLLGVARARARGDHDGIGGELLLYTIHGLHLDRVLTKEARPYFSIAGKSKLMAISAFTVTNPSNAVGQW